MLLFELRPLEAVESSALQTEVPFQESRTLSSPLTQVLVAVAVVFLSALLNYQCMLEANHSKFYFENFPCN